MALMQSAYSFLWACQHHWSFSSIFFISCGMLACTPFQCIQHPNGLSTNFDIQRSLMLEAWGPRSKVHFGHHCACALHLALRLHLHLGDGGKYPSTLRLHGGTFLHCFRFLVLRFRLNRYLPVLSAPLQSLVLARDFVICTEALVFTALALLSFAGLLWHLRILTPQASRHVDELSWCYPTVTV